MKQVGRDSNGSEHRLRRRSLVVIRCVSKSVKRSGRDLIELAERMRPQDAIDIDHVAQHSPLGSGLSLQRVQEVARVSPSHPARFERSGALGKVIGNRDRGGCSQMGWRCTTRFSQVPQKDVASEGEAESAEFPPGEDPSKMIDYQRQITGLARVIGARLAVYDPRA